MVDEPYRRMPTARDDLPRVTPASNLGMRISRVRLGSNTVKGREVDRLMERAESASERGAIGARAQLFKVGKQRVLIVFATFSVAALAVWLVVH